MAPRVIYSPRYNISLFGLERLHPFDSQKYGRAWRVLRKHFGKNLGAMSVCPNQPATREELLLVHSAAYLSKLRESRYLAKALELPVARYVPAWILDWRILRPMRWATAGTIQAARECLQHGLAINLSGGYHHAKPEFGEGFSIYADAAIAIRVLRKEGLLGNNTRVAYIDLDAHQGNGVCHCLEQDKQVFIFDMYNSQIYPAYDSAARERIDCNLRLSSACQGGEYLHTLQKNLPGFLDSVSREPTGLAIYNAGTDVFTGDPLGGLNLSAADILERDLFVVKQLRDRGIPTAMVLSGGYTKQSYQFVADSVIRLLEMAEH
jgi:histone deacetylase 11